MRSFLEKVFNWILGAFWGFYKRLILKTGGRGKTGKLVAVLGKLIVVPSLLKFRRIGAFGVLPTRLAMAVKDFLLRYSLIGITLACIYIICHLGLGWFFPVGASDNSENVNKVLLNLSYSFMAAFIFYLFVEYFPKRGLQKKAFLLWEEGIPYFSYPVVAKSDCENPILRNRRLLVRVQWGVMGFRP